MEVIPLNLMFTYPVKWNTYKILRDFVQNFYDARESEIWLDQFHYTYEGKVLTMESTGPGFSYEWLLHIGAGTKQNRKDAAGFFGEGFKVASLCALRDEKWDVTMSSRDWRIHVIRQDCRIDGVPCEQLSYELFKTEESERSVLRLKGVSEKQYNLFRDVLLGFYYPQNPLFGKLLYKDERTAVYRRSGLPVPDCLPITGQCGDRGVLFGRYQMVGTVPIPFVFADHAFEQENRERTSISIHKVLQVLYLIAGRVDPDTAEELLMSLKSKWGSYPQKQVDTESWYYVVCQLIRGVYCSERTCRHFLENNPGLFCGDRFWKRSNASINRRRAARAWMDTLPGPHRLVNQTFILLGVEDLERACEAAGGFQMDTDPTPKEEACIQILHRLCERIFPGFFADWEDVPVLVDRSTSSAFRGTAEIVRRKEKVKNCAGLDIRFTINRILMREDCLTRETFADAVSVFFHELCHMFGEDNTGNFSLALTEVIRILVQEKEVLEEAGEAWENIF